MLKSKSRIEFENYLCKNLKSPITEQSNEITKNIDLAKSGQEILALLSKTDQEIFDGWTFDLLKSEGLKSDLYILDKLSRLSSILACQINSGNKIKLILSGCGTSGRLAYLCSQTFNLITKLNLCEYIIAGDEFALVNSVESVEDRPEIGAEKLKSILEAGEGTRFVFIGITCGFSAPFVAGQIDQCFDEILNKKSDKILACGILGFNLVEMTRKTQTLNFYDLMVKLEKFEQEDSNRFFILNPLIGPEPITGSTRMKSGTATKIILDLILSKTLSLINKKGFDSQDELCMISYYQRLLSQVVYSNDTIKKLGEIIDESAESLKNLNYGGSINYLCDSERLGLLSCVDASECLPTYGAGKNDIKGFISASGGNSLSNEWCGFVKNCDSTWSCNIIGNLNDFKSSKCVFILIDDDNDGIKTNNFVHNKMEVEKLLIENSECKIYHLNFASKENKSENSSRIKFINLIGLTDILEEASIKVNSYFSNCLQEFVLKLCLNAISTGSHVLYGKTYENIMIDVKVSNIKLYWRAVEILKRLTEHGPEECETYLLRSIYSDAVVAETEIEKHVENATSQELVVPKALVMAITKCSFKEATQLLAESQNSVRNCIFKIKNNY